MKIKRWLLDRTGYLAEETLDSDRVLEFAGRCLDKAYANESVGEVLFEDTDGKYWTGSVEYVLQEADPDYVRDALKDHLDLEKRLGCLHDLGFDLSCTNLVDETVRVRCSQCVAVVINEVACHETGCPNHRDPPYLNDEEGTEGGDNPDKAYPENTPA